MNSLTLVSYSLLQKAFARTYRFATIHRTYRFATIQNVIDRQTTDRQTDRQTYDTVYHRLDR